MMVLTDCRETAARIPPFAEGTLPADERAALENHLRGCPNCRAALERFGRLQNLARGAFGAALGAEFAAETSKKLKAIAVSPRRLERERPEEEEPAAAAAPEGVLSRMGAAPWWIVSTALHALLILLIGLVTMAINRPDFESALVTVTSLDRKLEAKAEPPKPEARDVLKSLHDVPATDPNATETSTIIVPPDILAQAELGDHFETINPDRPDTQSAFGNPDARMFHSVSGNDEAEGGGGMGGSSLSEELIGVGGSNSPGTGGGWGGGNGTGVGIGDGAGKGSFGSRTGGGRRLMVMRHGGSKATESAVDAGLAWLARHQEPDGSWAFKKYEGGGRVWGTASEESMSALALLAFLGAGHTEKVGKYKENVKKAVEFLIKTQRADGGWGTPTNRDGQHYEEYDCALGTLALSESFGMARNPKTREAAQKGVDYCMKQQDYDGGGWAHMPLESTSLFGWMVMALKSAKVSGLGVNPNVMEKAVHWLEGVTDKTNEGSYPGYGRTWYSKSAKFYAHKGETMTAVGMLCFQFLGQGEKTKWQAEFTARMLPKWGEGTSLASDPQTSYHWYYATLGLFQHGGPEWKTWNEALKQALVPNQRKGGPLDGSVQDVDGSWDPVDVWSKIGGRVYSTALCTLCLEVYYRYLPMYR